MTTKQQNKRSMYLDVLAVRLMPSRPATRISPLTKGEDALRGQRMELDPVNLLHRIRPGQPDLGTLATGHPVGGPCQDDLRQFPAKLPDSWRLGEVGPTHPKEPANKRDGRTWKNPFEWVWPEILKRLQNEPDGTATSLLNQLGKSDPDRHNAGPLRSLRRRAGEGRSTMARTWALPCATGTIHVAPICSPALPTLGQSPLRLAAPASPATPPALEGAAPGPRGEKPRPSVSFGWSPFDGGNGVGIDHCR